MSPREFCDFCSGRFNRDDLTVISKARELACEECLEASEELREARAEYKAKGKGAA